MPKSRSSDGWWWSLLEAEFDASLPEEEAEEDDGIQRDRGLNIAGPRELWPVTALQLRFDKSWCETDTYNCERFTTLRHSRLVRKKMGGGSLLTRMLLSGYNVFNPAENSDSADLSKSGAHKARDQRGGP